MNIRKILYPTDFSKANRPVLEMASSLARENNAVLTVAHVLEIPVEAPPASIPQVAASMVPIAAAEQSAELKKVRPTYPGVSCEHRLLEGPTSDAIVKLAEDEQADLIVMGTHGHGALNRMLLGSVAEGVVRRAPCPVMTFKLDNDPDTPSNIRKILFPTDLSERSMSALGFASSLARDFDAELVLLHVEQTPVGYAVGEMNYAIVEPNIDELEARLQQFSPPHADVRCSRHVLTGDPGGTIEQFAKDNDIDLIFMTTHGRTGLTRMLMGSVAEKVVRNAVCPVVTARLSLVSEEQPQQQSAGAENG